ncbi:hypothetical protein H4R27_002555 [Coemansia aciculifera]|nr:hypothetical protein H4R27_002555 [Coemansia aciculifera]
MRAKAIYACVAENAGEVTFDAEDWLGKVSDSSEDGWLVGTVETTGDRGLFPVVYTELVPETGDDMRFLQKLQSSGLLSSTLKLEQFSRDLNSSTRPRPPPPPPPPTAVSLGQQAAAAPPVSTKPLFNQAPRPTRPLAPKPTTKPVMKPKSDPLPSVHQSQQPVLPPKPINVDSSDPELRRQKEREAAELWESKFGIGASSAAAARTKEVPPPPVAAKPAILSKPVATKPVVMSKPVATTAHKPVPTLAPKPTLKPKPAFNPQSEFRNIHPSTENDAPVLPFSSTRNAVQERLAQQQRNAQVAVSNPALENTPPALPYSPSRRIIAEPLIAPVESSIQPNPRQLIAQLNGGGVNGTARTAAHRTFEDNFDPQTLTHAPASNISTPTTTHNSGGSGIPLTAAREVKGTRPLVSAASSRSTTSVASMAQRQPVLPPKPAKQAPSVSRSVSFASHSGYSRPVDSTTTSSNSPSLLSPALSFTSSGGFQSPLTTAIHRSSAKSDAIPADALARYSHLFKRLDKQHGKRGFLNADEVHAVVIRCRLPDDLLRRIWALSDRNLNGKFGPGEFYIIMHLTDCALRQEPIPEILSVDLLRSAYPD